MYSGCGYEKVNRPLRGLISVNEKEAEYFKRLFLSDESKAFNDFYTDVAMCCGYYCLATVLQLYELQVC